MKSTVASRLYKSASKADAKVLALLLDGAFCRELTLANAWPHFSALKRALADHRSAASAKWLAEPTSVVFPKSGTLDEVIDSFTAESNR